MFETVPPDPPPVIGRATVIDGDTLEIHDQRIRLWGIDAPESRQTCTQAGETYRCGQVAAHALAALIDQKTVRCAPRGRPDRYRRIVAWCTISPWPAEDLRLTIDLGARMVQDGQALDWPRYSGGAYARWQTEAERERRGLWAGTFERPWDWRAR